MRFVIPHEAHLRPTWMIKAGLFIYDHLGRRNVLPASGKLDLRSEIEGAPLQEGYQQGFVYSDCQADDARLVLACVKDAAERGADIAVRTACTGLKAEGGLWRVGIEGGRSVQARCVVNATGPWARRFLKEHNLMGAYTPRMRLMKGSHAIVKKLYDGDHAYLLQQPDKRIVFVLPYLGAYSLIGTTDVEYKGDPLAARISEVEIAYLCDAVNRTFRTQIGAEDVVSSYSGVRPLIDDGKASGSKVSRDYKLVLETRYGPPLLNVFGGKLTTFRVLAEHAVDEVVGFFHDYGFAWTGSAVLPGGNMDGADFEAFLARQYEIYPDVPRGVVERLARAYGTRIDRVLGGKVGRDLGDGVYESEIRYMVEEEWARSLDDILWRRSKLGLIASDATRAAIEKALPALLKRYARG